jgi:acetate CoA/acetoacetate CoA-transferase beta subunit
MLHTNKGKHKILDECTLPYTAVNVVDMIVTEMGVMEVTKDGIVLTELHPDYTVEQVQEATGTKLIISPNLAQMDKDL